MNSLDKMEDYDRLQQEHAELRENFAALKNVLHDTQKQLAAANKRIEEAEKQEPCSWEVYADSSDISAMRGVIYSASYPEACHEHINDAINEHHFIEASTWKVRPVWSKPIPPADVAELQIKLDAASMRLKMKPKPLDVSDYKQRIAELERKLAEQQAVFVRMGYVGRFDGVEELNKLLSQEREKAVPEGIVSVEAGFDYLGYGVTQPTLKLFFSAGQDCNQLWVLRDRAKALLTPSPASLNAKEGEE